MLIYRMLEGTVSTHIEIKPAANNDLHMLFVRKVKLRLHDNQSQNIIVKDENLKISSFQHYPMLGIKIEEIIIV